MIVACSGDRFLALREARRILREAGGNATELADGTEPADIERALAQGGLFGAVRLHLDFDLAFSGPSATAARNEAIRILAGAPDDATVVVVDAKATPARQKRYRELGEVRHQPTPRYQALERWIAAEMQDAGMQAEREVAAVLADLFGEDLPAIAAEIRKLAVLEETLSGERVRTLVHRPAARDAFDMLRRIVAGDAAGALRVATGLIEAGEAPARILGAVAWQFGQVAAAVALLQGESDPPPRAVAAKELGVSPHQAERALTVAGSLTEAGLDAVYQRLAATERAAKRGDRDAAWAVQALAVDLAQRFAAAPEGGR